MIPGADPRRRPSADRPSGAARAAPGGVAAPTGRPTSCGVGADPSPPVDRAPDGPATTGPGRGLRRQAARQLGGSPDERPASSYRAPSASGRRPDRAPPSPTFWHELPLLIVVALVLTFLIQTFLAKVYVIPSGSMETTLHGCMGCNNDRVLVDKVSYRFADPAPGDVVVFRGPDSWSSEVIVEQPGTRWSAACSCSDRWSGWRRRTRRTSSSG